MTETTAGYAPAPNLMRTYRAEDRAMWEVPSTPLDGTAAAAQTYVDRITRSAWWRRTCPPSWMGDEHHRGSFLDNITPPRRVIVRAARGMGAHASTGSVYRHRGRWHPRISLGTEPVERTWGRPGWDVAAIAEPWVILHELAHIMVACSGSGSGHDRTFRYYHLALVRRWLGPTHAAALRASYKLERLTYVRPPSLG